jgi:hypothetical protein
MDIEDILKSRAASINAVLMLDQTSAYSTYPGKTPAPRVGILRHLEKLNEQTSHTLDTVVYKLRSEPLPEELSPVDFYMFRQRLLCAHDFLSRLEDSLPIPRWLSASSNDLEREDQWLLIGVWKEFGQFWLQNLAWRISRGVVQE